jgi:hypothetical protein
MTSTHRKAAHKKPKDQLDKKANKTLRDLLKREIAIQIASNRICLNNIAALRLLESDASDDVDSGSFRLEFDITVGQGPSAAPNMLAPRARDGGFATTEAPDGGTPSIPDAGTTTTSSGTGGGGTDAGTLTTVRVETTRNTGWSVKGSFGPVQIEIRDTTTVKETAERR